MSAKIKIGNRMPVDCLPPKIIASVGTTIIETPGTPVLDIPISIAQIAMSVQSVTESIKVEDSPAISEINRCQK